MVRKAMLPIGDQNPTRMTPFVNYLLLAANVAGFIAQLLYTQGFGEAATIAGYGLVPRRLILDPPGEAFTILTSMFMHGGLMHLGGNMLYLYIFGDNVEDALGHLRYLAFYLVCGLAAAVAQFLIGPSSPVPMVGASGAIAGVLGAYLVLYPRAPITVFVFIFFLSLPAWLVVGFWFVWNLLGGVGSLRPASRETTAFFAHIGGFLAGMLIVRSLVRRRFDLGRWQGWRTPPRGGRSRSRYEAWRG
jgi:membrane associated rhomboid family serine protease